MTTAAAPPPRMAQSRSACSALVDAQHVAGGGHDLGRAQRPRSEAVAVDQPARAAAERVARDADGGRRPGEPGEAGLAGGGRDGAPLRAGAEPRHAGVGVDGDGVEGAGAQQHRAVERRDGGRAVAGPLRRDAQPVGGGEPHGELDVGDGAGLGHGDRALVDGQVPGRARLVPGGVVGTDGATVERGVEVREIGAGDGGHDGLPGAEGVSCGLVLRRPGRGRP